MRIELYIVFKGLFVLSDFTLDLQFGITVFPVTAYQNELLSGKQVKIVGRVNPIDGEVVFGAGNHIINFDISQDRGCDLGVQVADMLFQIFVGPHILTLSVILACQSVQQTAVDVKPHPETDHSRPVIVALAGVGRNFAIRWSHL